MSIRLAFVAVVLVGCPTPYTPAPGAHNFDACDSDGGDQLCGFVVESGTAERVRTFTAGEYGLQIDPAAVVSLPFSWGDCFNGWVSFLARCDAGGSLRLEESFHGIVMGSASATPGTAWQPEQIHFTGQFMPTSQQIPFVRLRFINAGGASCVIDEVSLDSTSGYCP